jgi:hypothetical protein
LGSLAGYQATGAGYSNFIGGNAGGGATNSSYSNFIGESAGVKAISAPYSTLIGYKAGYNPSTFPPSSPGVGRNNIIIGTNITLPTNTTDSINLGGIIFAQGSYFDTASDPFSGSVANAKVGIGTPAPQFTLDVSGSARVTNGLTVTGSLRVVSGSSTELVVTDTGVTIGSAITDRHNLTGNLAITGSLTGFVSASTIASTTASINLSRANFFTLTLVSGSNTHISASNIQPGQTTSIRVTQPSSGTGSVTFSSAFKQPSGGSYTPTNTSNAVDILTIVSFDTTNAYVVNVNNLV